LGVALELKILVGSTRAGRAADLVLPWLVDRSATHGAFVVEVLDLRDWRLPMFGETHEGVIGLAGSGNSDAILRRWNSTVAAGDAYLFLTPEYNHSVPAVLKNAIDSVFGSFGFRNKAAGFVGYSAGLVGGARAVEHLAHIAIEAELVPLRNATLIAQIHQAFGADGRPHDPRYDDRLTVLLDDLAWWGDALRRARDAGELPPPHARREPARAELSRGGASGGRTPRSPAP
jgi:NAD(P)H-dependent FMN reductase